ncbi:hypothetical protein N7G274_004363 [Stereocaulon virgatum]|uniref:Uncharacterized protein n=1 Tax=Stereocaulon virgatum TaxID=373712 RepID=A0ABR4AD14_9LECA
MQTLGGFQSVLLDMNTKPDRVGHYYRLPGYSDLPVRDDLSTWNCNRDVAMSPCEPLVNAFKGLLEPDLGPAIVTCLQVFGDDEGRTPSLPAAEKLGLRR